MIPRIIHQIWIGPHRQPDWIAPWRALAGWEHRLWTERELDALEWHPHLRAIYERYLSQGRFSGAANVARVEMLLRDGGLYVDADTELLRDPADATWAQADCVVVHSPHLAPAADGRPTRLTNAVMGATAGHGFLVDYREALARVSLDALHPSWRRTGGELQTSVFNARWFGAPGVAVLPSRSFLPKTMHGGGEVSADTYGVHHFGTTKRLYGSV